jgi:hypothetical protein
LASREPLSGETGMLMLDDPEGFLTELRNVPIH